MGEGVQRLLAMHEKTKILGLSTTAIRYLDNQRNMADELFDGNVASEMTLGEAIVRGILNPPKYVLSVFSYQKDLSRYAKRVKVAKNKAVRDSAEKYLEALRRALEKADGVDVIFDIVNNIKSLQYRRNRARNASCNELLPFGDLRRPSGFVCDDGYRLDTWSSNQRSAYNGSARQGLFAEQIAKLEKSA